MLVVITGGTIDKVYNRVSGALDFSGGTNIPNFIPEKIFASYVKLILKDSLEMTDDDRKEIFSICLHTKENKVLITHGTDTMVESAMYLGKKQHELREKTIVFVGGMPWWVSNSNASFNIGFAIASLQLLATGIFIAMDAQIFSWENVIKNIELNQFDSITDCSVRSL